MQYSFILAALAAVSSAAPAPSPYGAVSVGTGQPFVAVTPAQILVAAPASRACPIVAAPGQECASSVTTAKRLTDAFNKYGHTSLGQMIALLGLMTLESGDFRFNVNVNNAGQGTRAMLMFNFVYDFAYDQPELKDQVFKLGGNKHLVLDYTNVGTVPVETRNAIRQLVLGDRYSFETASWFLNTKCDAKYAKQLTNGGFAAFKEYIATCIYAGEVTPARKKGWCLAAKALTPAGTAMPAECL